MHLEKRNKIYLAIGGIFIAFFVLFNLLFDPFKLMEPPAPNDPAFSIAKFRFEDYRSPDDIITILQREIHAGMAREDVDKVIYKAGGYMFRFGKSIERQKQLSRGRKANNPHPLQGITADIYVDYTMPWKGRPLEKMMPNITPGANRTITAHYGAHDELIVLFVSGKIAVIKDQQ